MQVISEVVVLGVVERLIEGEDLAKVPEHLAMMQRTVQQASHEVRQMMTGLRTGVSPPRTLEGLLGQTVEHFVEQLGMEIGLRVESGEPIQEAPEIHEQVVRIVQEALTNVHRHAGSSHTTVTLKRRGREVAVSVRDDGLGFDLNCSASGQRCFGLKVMEARAKRINGRLSVDSEPGRGTRVTVRWPMTEGQGGEKRW